MCGSCKENQKGLILLVFLILHNEKSLLGFFLQKRMPIWQQTDSYPMSSG